MSNLNNLNNGGFMDQIRCDKESYLIWKWHPKGSTQGQNTRENAVRLGSSLRVKDGEVAVFVYKQNDGKMQDFIEGPFDQIIQTKNLPILATLLGKAYDDGTPFQAEIYFINLAEVIQNKLSVPYFDVFDPRFDDFGIQVAVRGMISFGITDYKKFVKLHRLIGFSLEDFKKQIKSAVERYVKDVVTNSPIENGIPLLQIERKIGEINSIAEEKITQRLAEDFGVNVSGVDIAAIEIDKSDPSYADLMAVTKEVDKAVILAEKAAKMKDIADKQRIEVENYKERLRIEREEAQYAKHKQTQTTNIGAFQVEKQAEVGVAGAQALGQMGANGAGDINFSGGTGSGTGAGGGINMAALMTSMAVGGAVGQNIAGTMNKTMSGMNETGATPPPIKVTAYYLAVDGKPAGPYDLNTLKSMVPSNAFNKESLVWKEGMSEWAKAGSVEELKAVLGSEMPPIPEL